MARTKTEIENAMKLEFMANVELQAKYGFTDTAVFDDTFSIVSLERIWINIVASAIWLLENIFDAFSTEITERINSSIVTTKAWYYSKALEFQYGDDLVFDAATYQFKYAVIDDSKRVVKYVAVREVIDSSVTKLKIYYSGDDKLELSANERAAFESYIRNIAAAGTHFLFISQDPDSLAVNLQVYYNPLILDSTGTRINGGGKPVEEAINNYLDNLEYGGIFFSSKLVDMIQEAEGVTDVVLVSTKHNEAAAELVRRIDSVSGAFEFDSLNSTINYLVES